MGEALVLAVKGGPAEDALRQAGHENFAGKLVIDTTNPSGMIRRKTACFTPSPVPTSR